MKRTVGAFAVFLLVSAWSVQSQSERSVWEGVYTDDQAARGQAVFGTHCTRCHNVMEFSGGTFIGSWEGSTAFDFYSQLLKTMPMDNPGSLPLEQYADVVAYIFKLNEFPAGKEEMDTDPKRLGLIRIAAKK
jgi:mono/diheme cytochrome c family protein